MTAKQITELLQGRYKQPEWAFFSELHRGTGYRSFRRKTNPEQRFDGWAINCYPSKGHVKVAFEIKVSRSDFLSEVNNPNKRKQAIELSNEFYFVVPEGLVEVEEIPDDSGLMVATKDGLRVVKCSPINENPILDWNFVCSIARRNTDVSDNDYKELKQTNNRLRSAIRTIERERIQLRNELIAIKYERRKLEEELRVLQISLQYAESQGYTKLK